MTTDVRYFSVQRRGHGYLVARYENGHAHIDGENAGWECSVDEFYTAIREEYDGCKVEDCTAVILDAARKMRGMK